MKIPPKQVNRRYKGQDFVVKYNPTDKSWTWEVEHVNITRFDGLTDSMLKAIKAAERHIDKFHK